MKGKSFYYFCALAVLALLPLVGCSGGSGSPVKTTEKGTEVTVSGKVAIPAAGKSAALSGYSTVSLNTIYVIDAQDGTVLTNGAVASDGSFKDLKFTMATAKSILVFKAVVSTGAVRSIVPIDLSNPPAAGVIAASQPITVNINSNTDAIAKAVSLSLGLTGLLGDGGQTLASKAKTYADALTLVKDNGGQTLAYSGSGSLELAGTVGNSALLPAKAYVDFTADDVLNIKLGGAVASAFIPAKNPIVNVTVTNAATGKGISGLPASKFTVHFAQLKADGSTWLNYKLNPSGTFQGTNDRSFLPGNVTGNTVIDKGDGSYTLILNLDVTNSDALVASKADDATKDSAKLAYDASLIHRVAISVNATGAINPLTKAAVASNPNNVGSLVYDFIPGTGAKYVNPNGGNFARDIVTIAACDACHGPLVNHGHHFGSRPDTKICVVCHTVQNKKTGKPSTEFTNLIHTLHMGEELRTPVTDIAGINASEIKYPQDPRNCTTCHKGKDADNFKTKASANGCLSCHNSVNPSTGTNHFATGSTACDVCHSETGSKVADAHRTNIVTKNNPVAKAGVDTLSFEITDVSVNTSNQAVFKFKGKLNGSDIVMNTTGSGKTVLVDGYDPGVGVSGRSVGTYPYLYVGYSIPQDGIAKPADFNATISVHLGELLSGAKGTLAGPVNGVYTATITSATVPTNATMVTGLITGYGTLSKGGVNIVFQNVSKVATNYTARRAIVTNAKCNDCHEQLGQKPDFHGGLRNDAPGCQFCHNPNLANNGWAVNSSTFVHGLHGASQRTVPYTWHKTIAADGVTVSWSGEAIGYPGVVRNCEQCHVAGSYDYSGTANRAAAENNSLLYTTVASGIVDGTSTPSKTASMAPYVITGTDYGVKGAGTNLVNSPISAACFSCHDSAAARAHMTSNGGSIYEARSSAILKQESCLVCHGPRGADTTLPVTGAVPTIKTVHRWW